MLFLEQLMRFPPSARDNIQLDDNDLFGLTTMHSFDIEELLDIVEPGRWLSVQMLQAWCK
jgi:hypothetical protein